MKKAEKILADSRDVIAVLQHEASLSADCNFAVCREMAAIACDLVHDQCRPENGISDEQYIVLSGELAEVLWKIGNLFMALKYAKEAASQSLPETAVERARAQRKEWREKRLSAVLEKQRLAAKPAQASALQQALNTETGRAAMEDLLTLFAYEELSSGHLRRLALDALEGDLLLRVSVFLEQPPASTDCRSGLREDQLRPLHPMFRRRLLAAEHALQSDD